MKKVFGFAAVCALVVVPAMAASAPNYNAVCELFAQFGPILKTLRTLAFIGAAFILAAWAWDFISSGKVELKTVKEKGVGMLVGFVLLFAVGAVVTVFQNMAGPEGQWGCTIPF